MGDPLGSPRVAPLLLLAAFVFLIVFVLSFRTHFNLSHLTHDSRGKCKEFVGPTQRLEKLKVRDNDTVPPFYAFYTKKAITFDP